MSQLQQQLVDIEAPHEHDVLSGRGNFVNYHAGNEHFRALVRKHKVAYVACPKPQKGKFSKIIYNEIRGLNPPGRFLRQNPKTKLWDDIGEKKALDKTRQALREGAPDIMKELTTEEGDDQQQPVDTSSELKSGRGEVLVRKRSTSPEESSSQTPVITPSQSSKSPSQPGRVGSFRGGSSQQIPSPQQYVQTGLSPSLMHANNVQLGLEAAVLQSCSPGISSQQHQALLSQAQGIGSQHHLPVQTSSASTHFPQHHALNNVSIPQMQSPAPPLSSPQKISSSCSSIPIGGAVGMTSSDQQISGGVPSPMTSMNNIPLTSLTSLNQQSSGGTIPTHSFSSLNQQSSGSIPMTSLTLQSSGSLPMPHLEQQTSGGALPHPSALLHERQLLQERQQQLASAALNHAALLQGRQQQQDLQRLSQQQQSNHLPSRINVPTSRQQGNLMGSGYPLPNNGVMQSNKLPEMNGQQLPYVNAPSPFDQQTAGTEANANPEPQDDKCDADRVGPRRRPLKNLSKPVKRNEFTREGSESSIQVDSIFGGAKAHESALGPRNHESSHLSVMSLSIGDMGDNVPDLPNRTEQQQGASVNPDTLATRFNNSLSLRGGSGHHKLAKSNLRRTGSGDGTASRDSNDSEAGRQHGASYVMDMSVATLGDRLSELGDYSMAHLAESEANMSFSNVFEETDKDVLKTLK